MAKMAKMAKKKGEVKIFDAKKRKKAVMPIMFNL